MFAYYKRQDDLCCSPYTRDETRKQQPAKASKDQNPNGEPQGGETRAPTETTADMRRREQAARLSQENPSGLSVEQEQVSETNHLYMPKLLLSDGPNRAPRLAAPKTKVRKNPTTATTTTKTTNTTTTTTTTRRQARRTKWFDPQVWWHSVGGLAACLVLLLCAFTLVSCEEISAAANTGGGTERPAQQPQPNEQQIANFDNKPTSGGESGGASAQAQISSDDTQQKVSGEETLSAPASDASQNAGASKLSADTVAANNGEQSAESSQQLGDSPAAAPATNSPAPSDLDSAAATATNLQQQQQQLEEVSGSVPTPQDVAQDSQQPEQVLNTSTDQQQQQQQEQQTRATATTTTTTTTNSNYENDLLLPVSQYGGDSFGKKQHSSGESSSQRARDSAHGAIKSSRSLKRAFGGAHMGVFGRKRPNPPARHQQEQTTHQEQLTTTHADNPNANTNERVRPGKLKSQAHHHYYYQTVQQQQQQQEPQQSTSGGKQLKQADYPDYKEILVQPDNLGGGQEYEVHRHQVAVDVARSQPTTTSASPATAAAAVADQQDQVGKFEQDKVSVSDSDDASTESASAPEQQATTTTSSADHSGFEAQSAGETAPAKESQMPYIRLSNIATINSTTSTSGNSSGAHAPAGTGEMKLMRIYVIDLDQKLVVGGGGGGGSGGQNTYNPMASILDGTATTTAASTPAPSKTSSEPQVSEQAVEQVKVDSDSLDQQLQQQHPYSENSAQLMQTQQSSTVYATTGVPTGGEPDSTAPANESNLSPLSELAHAHNYTTSSSSSSGDVTGSHAGRHQQPHEHHTPGGSNYSRPHQHVVVVSDDYQKYAQQQQMHGGPAGKQAHNSGEFVYVDRDSLQANLSQLMAQMAHNSYIGAVAAAAAAPPPPPQAPVAHSSVGHFYHYPNHMLMTMSHQQPPAHNYSLVSGAQPAQQYYASNHQQVNYGSLPPPPQSPPNADSLVYLNPSPNNGTQSHYHTNHGNQYLGKSARAAEPPTTTQANYNWSQPAATTTTTTTGDHSQLQHYQLQSLSVAYPSFIQQQQQQAAAGSGVGQFAAVYPALATAPMQHHQVQQQQQQQPLVMSVPQYIAPQYAPVPAAAAAAAARPAQNYSSVGKSTGLAHDTTAGHAMIVSQQQLQPTVSIYKQQQQLVTAQDPSEQYSPPAPVEWHTAEGHPVSAASSAYNTQPQQQVMALVANDTNYKPSSSVVVGGGGGGGPDPADKYPPLANNKSASHLYVYSQQQPTVAEYLMYQQAQQQQQQHPILATGGYAHPATQTSEPGQQQQQHYYAQAHAHAQAQVDPYGAGGKVTTQQQQQQQPSDHWKPVDFVSPATSSHGVNFYPLKSGAGQQAATGGPAPQQSKSALLNGYSGQPDHDIVSLSARQQQRTLYSTNSSQTLTPTVAQQLMLSAAGYGASQAANTSAPLDSEHAHHSNTNYQQPPMAYVNSAPVAVELAPSQQVHAHPSFSSSSSSPPTSSLQYNGTGLGSQISLAQQQNVEAYQATSAGAGQPQPQQQQQIGVTNEYAGSQPQQPSYTSKRYKQANLGEQTSDEAPKIPHAHSSLTPTVTTTTGYRRPSDTSGSYAQLQEAEVVEQQQHSDESSYDPLAEHADYPKATGAKGHAGTKHAVGGQKSPTTGRPQKGAKPAPKKHQVKVVKQSDDEIVQQYAEPDQLSLQQAAHQQQQQQQVAGDLSGGGDQQELIYGGQQQQQTRQPGGGGGGARPYISGSGDLSTYVAPGAGGAPSYGNLMLRQPPTHYRPQPAHQTVAPSKPGLLSWETISSVASGAAKRIPGALSSFLSPFKYQQHPVYPTANFNPTQHQHPTQHLQFPKSAHYAGDVANFHRPYPLSHMSRPQSYSDSTGHGHSSHAAGDPSEHSHEHQVADSEDDTGEHEETADGGGTDLNGASSSSSSSSSLSGEQSGDSHTLNVTSHAYKPASSGLNASEIVGDLATISPDGRPAGAAKRRPIHGAGSKSKGAGSKRPTGAGGGGVKAAPTELKELDPAQAAVLSSIEHELAGHKPASQKGHKRKPGSKKSRPPVTSVSVPTTEDDLTKTTPFVDPTILAAAAHSGGGSIHLDSLPLDQQRLLLGKMAGTHNSLASYMKQTSLPGVGGAMFSSPEAAASALGSGPLPVHMMTSGGGGGGGPSHPVGGNGPQLNALQIGQYKIVPQTQFVQSIIEPSRQMLGQYFRQYLGQLNQFAAG